MIKPINKSLLFTYLTLIIIITFLYFSLNVIVTTWEGFNLWFIDFKKPETANFSAFIAGIFSFISSLLIIYTIYVQIKQNKEQNIQFAINQFENNYFKLIDFHSDNIKEFIHVRPDKATEEINTGIIVFKRIFEQFFEAYKIVDNNLDADILNGIYINETIKKENEKFINNILINNKNINKEDLHLTKTKINIAYLTVFYGTPEGDGSIEVLINILSKRYHIESLNKVLTELSSKKTAYYPHQRYFGGHQSRLGHYFRNLYQSISYVDKKTFLNESQKEDYVKIFRSQLSNYEQAIIFLNSLCILGESWEYNSVINDKEKGLISKYQFIKNIPQNFLSVVDIHPNYFYRHIKFEYEN